MKRQLRRIAVGTGGAALVALGVAMLVLPGPGLVVLAAALALLATEFAWAQTWRDRAFERVAKAKEQVRRRALKPAPEPDATSPMQ